MVRFNRKGRRVTTDPSEPTAPEDGNVVPLFPAGLQEDLVPLGGADDEADFGHETLGSGHAGAWSEARAAQLLDPPRGGHSYVAPAQTVAHLRLGIRVLGWAAGGAVMAAAALALISGSSPTRVSNPPRTTGAKPTAPSAESTSIAPAHPRLASRAAGGPTPHTQRRHHTKPTTAHHTQSTPANQSHVVPASFTTGTRTSTAGTRSETTTSRPYTPPVSAPAAPERTSATRGTNASAARSSSANRPAFGADGILGPGHSPDG